ncbi:MAG: hypothetical protein JKY94_01025 [Rhodobacteraceae bacterium]|nr:hypothetical protein [Paracoccaceae bacterium]
MTTTILGVLRMPEELALADHLSKTQFFAAARFAADELERLSAENEKLRAGVLRLSSLNAFHLSRAASPEERARAFYATAVLDPKEPAEIRKLRALGDVDSQCIVNAFDEGAALTPPTSEQKEKTDAG